MSFPEARIAVVLHAAEGRVREVEIVSSRLTRAARLFAGRPAAAVLTLLPAVFSLCGTAQALAGLAAMEQAAGITPSPQRQAARRARLLAETLREHGTTIARDWPALLGEVPDLEAAKALRHGEWAAFTPLLGAPPAEVAADVAAWAAAAETPAARLVRLVIDSGLAGFGAGPFLPMPAGGPPDLGERLAADADGAYAARPDHAGIVYETGPLARHPCGGGLLARLSARLAEVSEALQDLAGLGHDHLPERMDSTATGIGLGVVEAARGLLAHRVELKDGMVTDYRILAPTEWNFHPDGPLARGLRGAAVTPGLARNAALLVNALDPCVACSVKVV